MHTTLRPYTTAGVALLGAGVIAVTPVAPPTSDIERALPVRLSAAVDPITPWTDVLDEANANFTNIAEDWLAAPFPVLQQVIANQIGYLGELPDLGAIAGQIQDNLQAAAAAPFAQDLTTLDFLHGVAFGLLPAFVPALADPSLKPLLDFATSSFSGVLLGLVGPVVGPALALGAGTQAIGDALSGANPDPAEALNELINIPAAMTGAFLNGGQVLDLTPALSAIGPALGLELPAGTTIGLAFGGLLSPGGSIFNALDIGFTLAPGVTIQIPGQGPGAIGSLVDLSKVIAKAIGLDPAGSAVNPATSERTADNGPARVPASALGSSVTTVTTPTDSAVKKDATVHQEENPATDSESVNLSPAGSGGIADGSINAANQSNAAQGSPSVKLIRESANATPGQTGVKHESDGGRRSTDVLKSLRDKVRSATSNFDKGLKKGSEQKADTKTDTASDSHQAAS